MKTCWNKRVCTIILLTLSACARGTVVTLCVCVCVCVYLSVTALTATYIILKSKVRYQRGLHGVLNICNVWLSLKTLCSKVMASFAYHGCLPRSLHSCGYSILQSSGVLVAVASLL